MSAPSCANCGVPVTAGDRHCGECGHDISGIQEKVATVEVRESLSDQIDAYVVQTLKEATAGRYEIKHELGRGGMAVVYRAREIELDRPVAIKVMSPDIGRDAEQFENLSAKFKEEARTAAKLSHLHIIPIYAVGEHKGLLYFAMKFVSGTALDSILKEKRRLPIGMVEEIIAQVSGALDHAHRHGVIHRDIKPANIMIDGEGLAVVTDFGIAKKQEDQQAKTGTIIGTPEYMSPEQCAGLELSGAADQYSLGIAAYEMIAGTRPIQGDSVWDTLSRQASDPPPPIESFRPDCPPYLRVMIHRMLEKDPADRYATLEEVVRLVRRETPTVEDAVRTELLTLAAAGIEKQKQLADRPLPQLTVPSRPTAESGSMVPGALTGAPTRPKRRSVMTLTAIAFVVAGTGFGWSEWQKRIAPPAGESPIAGAAEVLALGPADTLATGNDSTSATQEPESAALDSAVIDTPAEAAIVVPPPVVNRPAPPRPARLIVTGLPPDGRILVDGLWQPEPDFELKAGRYDLALEAPGYVTESISVTVGRGDVRTIAFSGRIVQEVAGPDPIPVETEPVVPDSGLLQVLVNPRADLEVNGARVGRIRSHEAVLPTAKQYCLRLTREAYRTLDTLVTLIPNGTVRLTLRLELGEGRTGTSCSG